MISHRRGTARRGRRPREPSSRASELPAQESQAQLPDGSDLVPEPPAEARGSASEGPLAEVRGSASDREPRIEGERAERRVVAREDAAVGERPSDWTRFEIGHNLRSLRPNHEPTIIRTLRKLHLRWWRAGLSNAQQILRQRGLGDDVISYIPDIISACKECRIWAAKGRDTKPSISIAMNFNEVVETDLMYYKEFVIHHFVCRASRWHTAMQTPSRTEEQLLENIFTCWVNTFGPMTTLVSDMESGLSTEAVKARLARAGITMKLRGKDQRARYIERRGAILRHSMHVMDAQAVREGIDLSFGTLLASCVLQGTQ